MVLRVIVFLPLIGPSIISILIDFLSSSLTISLHLEFLKAITTSLSIVSPALLIFFIDFVPCQNSGSLSISDITFHTLSKVAFTSLLVCIRTKSFYPNVKEQLNNNKFSKLFYFLLCIVGLCIVCIIIHSFQPSTQYFEVIQDIPFNYSWQMLDVRYIIAYDIEVSHSDLYFDFTAF